MTVHELVVHEVRAAADRRRRGLLGALLERHLRARHRPRPGRGPRRRRPPHRAAPHRRRRLRPVRRLHPRRPGERDLAPLRADRRRRAGDASRRTTSTTRRPPTCGWAAGSPSTCPRTGRWRSSRPTGSSSPSTSDAARPGGRRGGRVRLISTGLVDPKGCWANAWSGARCRPRVTSTQRRRIQHNGENTCQHPSSVPPSTSLALVGAASLSVDRRVRARGGGHRAGPGQHQQEAHRDDADRRPARRQHVRHHHRARSSRPSSSRSRPPATPPRRPMRDIDKGLDQGKIKQLKRFEANDDARSAALAATPTTRARSSSTLAARHLLGARHQRPTTAAKFFAFTVAGARHRQRHAGVARRSRPSPRAKWANKPAVDPQQGSARPSPTARARTTSSRWSSSRRARRSRTSRSGS